MANPDHGRWLLDDPIAQTLFGLIAGRKEKNRQSYAAMVISPQFLISSIARNVIVYNHEPWKRQGYANHAEGMALAVADVLRVPLAGSYIYTLGLLEGNTPFIHNEQGDPPSERYTCLRCSNWFSNFGVAGICIPTKNEWRFLTTQEALHTSQLFSEEDGDNASRRQDANVPLDTGLVQELLHRGKQETAASSKERLESAGYQLSPEVETLLACAKHGYLDGNLFKAMAIRLIAESKEK